MPTTEKYTVSGTDVVQKVKQLIHEGNIRRIRVLQKSVVVMEIPLTAGAIAILAAPILAALGAFAALVTECTIEVEKIEPKEPPKS
jgi:hypothetical protein